MRRSLERQLSITLGLTVVLVGIAAGAISFWLAYQDAQEFQDDTLRQIAAMASNDVLHEAIHLNGSAANIDPEVRVMVVKLPATGKALNWLTSDLQSGFHTLDSDTGAWRVYVRRSNGSAIAAVQATQARNEIAIHNALHAILPLILLLPVVLWLVVRIVRKELAPVHMLAQNLDAQEPGNPATLPDKNIPDEIVPFVTSINQLLERIRQLLSEQRRFIADAAHELRTPLTALSLQAQNLERADTLEAMRDRIVPLKEGIERGRRMTEQLLSHARNQISTPVLEVINLSKMMRDLVADHLQLAESKGIDIGLEGDEQLVLRTDPQMLSLVLKNALGNAIAYTPPDGAITLRFYEEGQDIVIEVIDSGPGIPDSEKDRVFAPFYRIAGTEGSGSGLGLSIAHDAALRLGGAISLKNRSSEAGLIFSYRQRLIA